MERQIGITHNHCGGVTTSTARQQDNWEWGRKDVCYLFNWTLPVRVVVSVLTGGFTFFTGSRQRTDEQLRAQAGPRLAVVLAPAPSHSLSWTEVTTGSLWIVLASGGRLQTLILCTYVAIFPSYQEKNIGFFFSCWASAEWLGLLYLTVWMWPISLLHNNDVNDKYWQQQKHFQPILSKDWSRPEKEGHPTMLEEEKSHQLFC